MVSVLIAKFEELAPKLQPVLDRVKALAIKLMPKLKEQFDRAVQAIKPVIAKIKEFIKANPTAVIAGIATVLGVILGGALIATVAAIAGVVTSFGFLVVAIGAGVTALVHFWQNSEKFRDIVNGVFEAVKAVAIPVIQGIMDTLENLKTVFKGITDFLKGVFTGDFDLAMEGIKGILSGAVRQIVIVLRTVKDAFTNFFSLDTVQAGIKIAVDRIITIFKAIPGRVASFARGMFDAILTEFAKVANGIIKLYNKIPILPDVPTIAIPQAAAPSVPSTAAIRERSSSLSGSTAPVINNNTYVMPNMDPESFEPLMREDNRNNGPIEANVGFY
jgi:phage-related protein